MSPTKSANYNHAINIAADFSRFPGGRYRTDGDASAERFRDDFLTSALRTGNVTVTMDGTLGYSAAWLEEAFGGLVRVSGFTGDEVRGRLLVVSEDRSLLYSIAKYISEASIRQLTPKEPAQPTIP